jgi:anti-sigma factor RsiW
MNVRDSSRRLIGAYLDGETTVQERIQVEQWLGTSPEHRQVLEELRSLNDSLQRLPRFRLPDGFCDRVLTCVKQRVTPAARLPKRSRGRRHRPANQALGA